MRIGVQVWGLWLVAVSSAVAAEPVLKRSDVVFMYQAGRPTYEAYGLCMRSPDGFWGGPSWEAAVAA